MTERMFFNKLMNVKTKTPEVWDRLLPIVKRVMQRMAFDVEPRFRDLTEQHQK